MNVNKLYLSKPHYLMPAHIEKEFICKKQNREYAEGMEVTTK